MYKSSVHFVHLDIESSYGSGQFSVGSDRFGPRFLQIFDRSELVGSARVRLRQFDMKNYYVMLHYT